MRSSQVGAWVVMLAALVVPGAWSQSITTDNDIQTDGQLVSTVERGTAPLEVSSSTTVRDLSADYLDGKHGNAFALAAELLTAIESLDSPDSLCFDASKRFVDCGNGTVADTATGLIWLEKADCLAISDWTTANQTAALLFDGATIDSMAGDCDLSDGSRPGDWRLATKEEWEGILDSDCSTDPEIVGNGSPTLGCFSDNSGANEWASGVAPSYYWSSRTSDGPTKAWAAYLADGIIVSASKVTDVFVWPVRSGQ